MRIDSAHSSIYKPNWKQPRTGTPKLLKKEQVKYLAFEGGGGKGVAFIGALQALEEAGVIRHTNAGPGGIPRTTAARQADTRKVPSIARTPQRVDNNRLKGVSGSSAGAITALMVSLGMSSKQIADLVVTMDFSQELKSRHLCDRPQVKGSRKLSPADVTEMLQHLDGQTGAGKLRKKIGPAGYTKSIGHGITTYQAALRRGWQVFKLRPPSSKIKASNLFKKHNDPGGKLLAESAASMVRLAGLVGGSVLKLAKIRGWLEAESRKMIRKVVDVPVTSMSHPLANLVLDNGMFDGAGFHSFFDWVICARVSEVLYSKLIGTQTGDNKHRDAVAAVHKVVENMNFTFEELYQLFGVKLVITGANLSTGKLELFSVDHTPFFPVAAAVRISMSLPVFMKPIVIDRATLDTLNNQAGVPANKKRKPLSDNYLGTWIDGGLFNNAPHRVFDHEYTQRNHPETLLFRLERDPRETLDSFGKFRTQLLLFLKGLAGESHISKSNQMHGYNNIIRLPAIYEKVAISELGFPEMQEVVLSTMKFKVPASELKTVQEKTHAQTEQYFKDAQKSASLDFIPDTNGLPAMLPSSPLAVA